jgi:hypothetical protein
MVGGTVGATTAQQLIKQLLLVDGMINNKFAQRAV